jgi:chromate transporter
MNHLPESVCLRELAFAFLRLGVTSIGGPAAHIANMELEFVHRRKWLSHEKFLDLVGAASLIPGPSSSELAIYIGQLLAGPRGLAVAGACFILPAAFIVLGFAWIYARYGTLPEVAGILYGIKPVMIAIILQASLSLGRVAVKTRTLAAIGIGAFLLNAAGINLFLILVFAGLTSVGVRHLGKFQNKLAITTALISCGLHEAYATPPVEAVPSLNKIFLFFLKVGSIQFGSGYVLLAFLRTDLVDHWHWLTEAQLLDATAVGQFTPGPVFTTATFIGFLVRGLPGALWATIGIFLPAFLLVMVSGRWIPKIRNSPHAGAFLDGVNVASLSLMAFVSLELGRAALIDLPTVGIAAVSGLVLFRYRPNSGWLVLAGGIVGRIFFHPQ